MKIIKILLLWLVCYSPQCFALSEAIYAFNDSSQKNIYRQITTNLSCIDCQNDNLANSKTQMAMELRQQIAARVKQGESTAQIVRYLLQTSDDNIIYYPPLMQKPWVLWSVPFVFLLFGLSVLYIVVNFIKRKEKQKDDLFVSN